MLSVKLKLLRRLLHEHMRIYVRELCCLYMTLTYAISVGDFLSILSEIERNYLCALPILKPHYDQLIFASSFYLTGLTMSVMKSLALRRNLYHYWTSKFCYNLRGPLALSNSSPWLFSLDSVYLFISFAWVNR